MNNKKYTAPRSDWGKSCKSAMALKGITMKELAKSVSLSYNYVSAIINCRTVPPMETIEAISNFLEIPVSEYSA